MGSNYGSNDGFNEESNEENNFSSMSQSTQNGDEKPKVSGFSHEYSSSSNTKQEPGKKAKGKMMMKEKNAKFGTNIKENKLGMFEGNIKVVICSVAILL